MTAAARLNTVIARAIAPRRPLSVSKWADQERHLSSKASPKPGRWRTDTNPPLREPMDCMSKGSGVHEVVILFPIQFGKTEVELNVLGYTMDHDPCPTIVVLPDDLTKDAWTLQKFNPMIEATPAVLASLTSNASRDSANQRAFKDFAGGQLFIEHGKTASRLALRTARKVLVDELDKFVTALPSGEDPIELLKGRTSAFPTNYLRCYIGSPGVKGISRLEYFYEKSDQRRYFVPCPHCGTEQPLEWKGLQWNDDATDCWYTCRESGCVIREADKTSMVARGRWIATNADCKPDAIRGYHINCLYYPIGMGPRWLDLARMWIESQGDPSKLQVFVQERLAESWEDPSMRAVRHNLLRDRAESYSLRTAPIGVTDITVGVDTQDNRLELHLVGWGRNMRWWTIDYLVLPGDPAEDHVWAMLTDILNRPIDHACGRKIRACASAIDMGGHRTEAVKAWVRRALVRRPMAVHGAVANNAPILGKAKLQDVTWKGRTDKRGVPIYQVGTVAAKHFLYSRIAVDADLKREGDALVPKTPADYLVHVSDQLPDEYFTGLVSETYNPAKNRFEKRNGVRNEPLDTWVYAYAAAHHPEIRLHRRTRAEWTEAEARFSTNPQTGNVPHETSETREQQQPAGPAQRQSVAIRRRGKGRFATSW